MPADAGRSVAEIDPVQQHQPDDLAEAHRDDREIVAAQAQHGKAENQAERRREHAGERQHDQKPRPYCVLSSA
jgi:hypothetical protein